MSRNSGRSSKRMIVCPANDKPEKLVKTSGIPAICVNISRRRVALGMEQKELADLLSIHRNTVSSWESGRTNPDASLVPALCKVLQFTPYELFSMEEPQQYTSREERLVKNYRKLDSKFKVHIDAMVASLVQTLEEEDVPDLYEIKFQPIRLAAGPDAGFRDITEAETLYLHNAPMLHRADGVYKVNGDSMEPTYHDGDMVLVEHIPDGSALRFGEIGAFASGNESYVKEFQADGLHSHNEHYDVMRFGDDTPVFLIGRVLGEVEPEQMATDEEIKRYLCHKQSVG